MPALLAAIMAVALAPGAASAAITEFEIEPGAAAGTHNPRYIHPGPDGNLWFTMTGTKGGIGRMTTTGGVLPDIPDSRGPLDFTVSPDGTVTWTGEDGRGRRLPSGRVDTIADTPTYAISLTAAGEVRWSETFPGLLGICRPGSATDFGARPTCAFGFPAGGRITDLELAPNGRMWATLYENNTVRQLDASTSTGPDLTVDLVAGSGPARMAVGPDGNLWITLFDLGAIQRITPAGVASPPFMLPVGSQPNDITAGPDGALWFTELGTNKIGRMTTSGVLTEFAVPTPDAYPVGITAGPDGAIWFTEPSAQKIARLTLDTAPAPGAPGAGSPGTGAPGGTGVSSGPGAGAAPSVGGAGLLADAVAPRFQRAPALVPSRFVAVGTSRSKVKRSVPRGSALTFFLSEAATAKVTIARIGAGRKVGGICRTTSSSNRRKPRCTKYTTMGSMTREATAGANAISISGKLGGRALPAGRYRLGIVAIDAAGNASATGTASFTIAG